MNRKEIKEEAKAKIKGNIWNILWPLLVIGVISGVISTIIGGGSSYNFEAIDAALYTSPRLAAATSVSSIVGAFLSAGYIKYLMTFVRTGKFDSNEIITTIKEKWVNIIIADILVYIIVFACSLLLVVPGIIMAIAYSFAIYLVVDTNIAGNDALKESREMMKGYKWDYFVFGLSFLCLIILGIFTLGILYIWLIPYMSVATILYYDKLRAKAKKVE